MILEDRLRARRPIRRKNDHRMPGVPECSAITEEFPVPVLGSPKVASQIAVFEIALLQLSQSLVATIHFSPFTGEWFTDILFIHGFFFRSKKARSVHSHIHLAITRECCTR